MICGLDAELVLDITAWVREDPAFSLTFRQIVGVKRSYTVRGSGQKPAPTCVMHGFVGHTLMQIQFLGIRDALHDHACICKSCHNLSRWQVTHIVALV